MPSKTKHLWKQLTGPGLLRAVAIFLFIVLLAALGSAGYVSTATATTILPGVHVMQTDLSGLTSDAAEKLLREAVEKVTLTYVDHADKLTISPLAKTATKQGPIATVDVGAAVAQALQVGKNPHPFIALGQRLRAKFLGVNIPLPYHIDSDRLTAAITEHFGLLVKPAQDARLKIVADKVGTTSITIIPETQGTELNRSQLITAAQAALQTLMSTETPVAVTADEPDIFAKDLEPLRTAVTPLLAHLPIRVTAGKDNWVITRQEAAQWIVPVKTAKDLALGIDAKALEAYLQPRADLLAVKPLDAVFTEKDGRVTTFVPSQDGTMLDMATSIGRITDAVMVGSDDTKGVVDLPIITDVAKITTAASNPYGIKEIIGVGSSNFKGSPKNRISNIEVGRKSLDGILIKPSEEFSLIKTLSPIDGDHGYLEELVIKGKETKPEFGGGLCQIGTTTFRAVLDTGLPVLERRNHSYRVTYYELDGDGINIGPGKDATIYDPWPDFRFKNDMATSILIQTKVVGKNKLEFDFWGTKDGRTAEQTNSVILTSTPPPPKKVIKTISIPPGTTKCTEHAHPGATAKFDYTVTYASGEKKQKTFNSTYKPWGEVCLAGVTQEQLDAAKAAGEVDDEGAVILSADAAGATGVQ